MRTETISIHGGFTCDPATKSVAPPIYQTVAYEFDSADQAAALFNLEIPGFRYSRISNPTTEILEKRVAELEGGHSALAVASGQAALAYAFLTLADRGGGIVAPPQLYGTTHTLLAHARGLPLIVDNTVATPAFLRPIEHGADIVVHSLTKFMGGHGAVMGGAIVDSGRFDWKAQRAKFPMLCEPDESYHGLVYVDHYGRGAFLGRARSVYLRATGAVLAPMSAFLILQGVETLALRMQRHVENARAVAQFLRGHKAVAWVDYVGFPDSPYHALAQKYLGGRAPSLFTFGPKGGFEAAKAFYDALRLIKRLVNIGDTRTLCCHPASSTHRQMSPDEQRRAGVRAETVRLSVGLEHIDDILEDLSQALDAA